MTETTVNHAPPGQRDFIAEGGRSAVAAARNGAAAINETARTAAMRAVNGVRRIDRRRVYAWLIRIVWLPLLLLTYLVVTAEGLRSLFDLFATPLHKCLPILAFLKDFRETRKIDLAIVMSMALLGSVWFAWEKLCGKYINPPERMNNEEKLLWFVGLGLLGTDAAVFFAGVWCGGSFLTNSGGAFVAAFVVTALYVLMLMFVSYVIVKLESKEN